jgi:type IV secretory pathway protease TraF
VKGKHALFALSVSFSLLTLVLRPGKIFILNFTASSPRGLYLVSRKPPGAGDFVIVNSDSLPFNNGIKDALFLKKVAFAGNERIVIDRNRLEVGGTRVFEKILDTGVLYDGTLKSGECVLLGTHERSFDSRYFGPVKLAGCRRVVPLFLIDRYEAHPF